MQTENMWQNVVSDHGLHYWPPSQQFLDAWHSFRIFFNQTLLIFLISPGKHNFMLCPDKRGYQVNIFLIPPQKDMLWVLMSTTTCFHREIRKMLVLFRQKKSTLSGAMVMGTNEKHLAEALLISLEIKIFTWYPILSGAIWIDRYM